MSATVIAVDGPSGSGKGTICKLLAEKLGYHLLDSGALYRVLALAVDKKGVDTQDHKAVARVAEGLNVEFDVSGAETQVLLDGENITLELRKETTGNMASKVAPIPAARKALLTRQKAFARAPGLVADGRDMGTVVFPDAPVKIYLTASAEERAQRRYKQLKDKGVSVNLPQLLNEITERDHRDMNREVAPLKPAEDAHQVDTTGLSIEEVFAKVTELTQQTLA